MAPISVSMYAPGALDVIGGAGDLVVEAGSLLSEVCKHGSIIRLLAVSGASCECVRLAFW